MKLEEQEKIQNMKMCSIDNCSKVVYGHSLCRSHCRNLRLYGNPLLDGRDYIGRKYHLYEIDIDIDIVTVWTMKGEEFFIDLCDLHFIKDITFHTDKRNYLYGGNRKMKTKQLHRLIMGDPEGLEIDHIDGNPLNNRRNNLRVCSHADNSKNISAMPSSKTGIKGVCWCNRKMKWRAYITSDNKRVHIGYYDNIEDAKQNRLIKQRELHKEFSREF